MTKPTHTELETENVRLRRRVTELEDLVRGLTQQLAEMLRSPRRQTPPAPPKELKDGHEGIGI